MSVHMAYRFSMQRNSRLIVAVLVATAAAAAGCATDDTGSTPSSVRTEISTTVMTTTVTSPPSSPSTSTQAASGYVGTLVPTRGRTETTTFDVNLPQVTGGQAPVRERFNTGMRSALTDVVNQLSDATVSDGTLLGDERSRVTTTTQQVVAGVAIFSTYGRGAAHPNNTVATITINADTAQPILLSEVFTDQNAAAARLAASVNRIDSRANPVAADINNFANWVPLQSGFHVYVPVSHAAGDYLPVTVPWNEIADLMKPGMQAVLAG